jgi:hypothetical protein
MLTKPRKPEVDHRTLKLLVGIIAISLGSLTSFFAGEPLKSISASYHEGGWSQSFFVGFLFAIAAFLLSYNGKSRCEMILSKVAAIAAFGVAMFPCKCNDKTEIIEYVHATSAAVMFLILAYFCYVFYKRAKVKGHTEAVRREVVYAACGAVIMISMLVLSLDAVLGHRFSDQVERLTFFGETAALIAFGISWLTASRTLPVLTNPTERFSPMNGSDTPDDAVVVKTGAA